MTTIAFDVDGTLFDEKGQPRWDIIAILRNLVPYCQVVVWSGSGMDYARHMGEKLFFPSEVLYWSKGKLSADIAFDDQDVTLGIVNVNVGELWVTTANTGKSSPRKEASPRTSRWWCSGAGTSSCPRC